MVIPVGSQWDYQASCAAGAGAGPCGCLQQRRRQAHHPCAALHATQACCAGAGPLPQVMQCIDKDMEGEVHKHDLMCARRLPLLGAARWLPLPTQRSSTGQLQPAAAEAARNLLSPAAGMFATCR